MTKWVNSHDSLNKSSYYARSTWAERQQEESKIYRFYPECALYWTIHVTWEHAHAHQVAGQVKGKKSKPCKEYKRSNTSDQWQGEMMWTCCRSECRGSIFGTVLEKIQNGCWRQVGGALGPEEALDRWESVYWEGHEQALDGVLEVRKGALDLNIVISQPWLYNVQRRKHETMMSLAPQNI
jgi:hypothetical protein